MRRYETLLLISPELPADARKELIEAMTGIIKREKGTIITVDEWGMRELAYPVKKQLRGYYVRLEYALDGAAVQELERNIRINDGIFKFVTVKLDDTAEVAETAEEES
jgi:small subunit ribosomal protein S6